MAPSSSAPPPQGPHDRPSPLATPAPATTSFGRASASPSPGRTPQPPSPPLSPDAEPFHPGGASTGRGKQLRWRDATPSASEDDEGAESPCGPSYREALLCPAPAPAPAKPTPVAAALSSTATAPRPRSPAPATTRLVHDRLGPRGEARNVHDRLGPRDEVRSGRHRQRRRGQTKLIHGLPLRNDNNKGAERPRLRSVVTRPVRGPSPPPVDEEGFTRYEGSRSTRRRRQRKAQRVAQRQAQPPARPRPAAPRIPPELVGRCLNCLSYRHLVAQCKLPTRCLRCRGFWHLARDCKRPRNPACSSSSGAGGGRCLARARRESPPTPTEHAARGPTPPPSPPPARQDQARQERRRSHSPAPRRGRSPVPGHRRRRHAREERPHGHPRAVRLAQEPADAPGHANGRRQPGHLRGNEAPVSPARQTDHGQVPDWRQEDDVVMDDVGHTSEDDSVSQPELRLEHEHADILIHLRVNARPYIRQRKALKYDVLIQLRSVADFHSKSPPPSLRNSSPPSSDGDSGHDGNPDRTHGDHGGDGGPRFGNSVMLGMTDDLAAPHGAGWGVAGATAATVNAHPAVVDTNAAVVDDHPVAVDAVVQPASSEALSEATAMPLVSTLSPRESTTTTVHTEPHPLGTPMVESEPSPLVAPVEAAMEEAGPAAVPAPSFSPGARPLEGGRMLVMATATPTEASNAISDKAKAKAMPTRPVPAPELLQLSTCTGPATTEMAKALGFPEGVKDSGALASREHGMGTLSLREQKPIRPGQEETASEPIRFEFEPSSPMLIRPHEDNEATPAMKTYSRRRRRSDAARSTDPAALHHDLRPGAEPLAEPGQQVPGADGLAAQLEAQGATGAEASTTPRAPCARKCQKTKPAELEEAKAATAAFLASVSQALQAPLASLPPRRCAAPSTPRSRRSDRLAKDPLNATVRPSKKGEILVMRKLGLCPPEGQARPTQDLSSVFENSHSFAAIRDIFPAAQALSDADLLALAAQDGGEGTSVC